MSSWRTTRLMQVWNKTHLLGIDSFLLARDLVRKGNKYTAREILLSHAQNNNGVASSFLVIDKEVNLLKYFGFMGYLREKQIGALWHPVAKRLFYGSTSYSSTSTGGGAPQDPDNHKRNKKQVARVAFMITSTQRAELNERLGYSPEAIKQLKPVEASLILQHDLAPDDKDGKLAELVQEYNDDLARQHQEAKLQAEKLAASQRVASAGATKGDHEETVVLDGTAAYTDSDKTTSNVASVGKAKEWFEVIETRVSDDSSIAVALYQDEDEAKLCLELKEGFADRRAREKQEDPATTYSIRKKVK